MAEKIDYGVDAPEVPRNFALVAAACLALFLFLPEKVRIGQTVVHGISHLFLFPGIVFAVQAMLYMFYVKKGKLLHRDRMLAEHPWRGDEQVLDVGCGRGLLLAGAAKRLTTGHAIGIDLWSNEDMGGNSASATERNLRLDGVADRTSVETMNAAAMSFPDGQFDVVVSNLCLHNIYDVSLRRQALLEVVRVLKRGGVLLVSDYKLTGEYAAEFAAAGLAVERHWGAWYNFPPLRIVVARKTGA